jgi:hypothetical protein
VAFVARHNRREKKDFVFGADTKGPGTFGRPKRLALFEASSLGLSVNRARSLGSCLAGEKSGGAKVSPSPPFLLGSPFSAKETGREKKLDSLSPPPLPTRQPSQTPTIGRRKSPRGVQPYCPVAHRRLESLSPRGTLFSSPRFLLLDYAMRCYLSFLLVRTTVELPGFAHSIVPVEWDAMRLDSLR